MDFFDLVMRGWNGLLVAAVACFIIAIEAAVPEIFEKGRIGNRLEVFAPIVICVLAAAFVPGPWMPPDVVVGQKVVLGVLMGFAAYAFGGTLKRNGARWLGDVMMKRLKEGPPAKKKASVAPPPVQE